MKKIIFAFLLFILVGCTVTTQDSKPVEDVKTEEPNDSVVEDSVITNIYGNLTISSTVKDAYTKNGTTINITKGGEYTLKGTFEGSIVCAANIVDKVTLYLNGLTLTSTNNHAIYWQSENGRIEIKAVENTKNSITVNTKGSNLYSAIESENNIEIGGSGTLNIKGLQRHAVKGSNIEIKGTVNLTIEAEKDGLHGKHVLISGGNTTINNCTDAIQAELNSNGIKGSIIVEEGSLTINNCKRAFRAESIVTIEQLDGSSIIVKVNNTETTFEALNINYVSGVLLVDGVAYRK